MTRRIVALAVLALLAAGCQAGAGAEINIKPGGGSAAARSRTIAVKVVAPGELAGAGGKILTDGGAGLIKGGQILTDGGAGLVARRALRAAVDKLAPVQAAGVQALGLDGKPIGAVAATDGEGGAKLADLPAGKPVSLLAAFRAGGKVYRLAALVAADEAAPTVMIDPINTMVEAAVRAVLGGKDVPALTNARLGRVWTICNKAEVALAPAELEAGRSPAELQAALVAAWKAAIDAKITSADEKAEIRAFMAELEALKN